MNEIIENLEKITTEQLKQCEQNKTIPSKEVLDIVTIIMTCRVSGLIF